MRTRVRPRGRTWACHVGVPRGRARFRARGVGGCRGEGILASVNSWGCRGVWSRARVGAMTTRREILATINATTRETCYERVLAGDFLAAIQADNIAALEKALRSLARVALTPWAFALAVHAICGTTVKRHTVGSRAAWSRIPGWALRHREHPLSALAIVCYLVREGRSDRDVVEALLVLSGWWS